MNQTAYENRDTSFSEIQARPERRFKAVDQTNEIMIRAQWLKLRSTAIGLAFATGVCLLFNDGEFNLMITMGLYFWGYYISAVKEVLPVGGLLGTILATVATTVVIIGLNSLLWDYKVINAVIMLILFIFPFVRTVILPVWNLIRYHLAANTQ